jgi:tartrate-resistant acid phosphatase type 5
MKLGSDFDKQFGYSRRRVLRTLFCSSAALSLNVLPKSVAAEGAKGSLNFLAIGDFGSTSKEQKAVSAAMQAYVKELAIVPDGLLLIGDNFYSKMEGGLQSERWESGFEQMYPASAFPGPAYAVLGNHDYHDNAGGEKMQLAYGAHKQGTRWTMPAKWYRKDLGPESAPLVTVLFVDSNLPAVSGAKDGKTGKPKASLTVAEEAEQQSWLEKQLLGPRAVLTLVVGHHPLYSNGSHGDTKPLIEAWGDLFEKHGVHAYLCGHDHDLQHLEIEGLKTSFVLSGGGGAKLRAMKSNREVPYANPVYGFTHLQISEGQMRFRHVGVDGKSLHAFTKSADGAVKLEA